MNNENVIIKGLIEYNIELPVLNTFNNIKKKYNIQYDDDILYDLFTNENVQNISKEHIILTKETLKGIPECQGIEKFEDFTEFNRIVETRCIYAWKINNELDDNTIIMEKLSHSKHIEIKRMYLIRSIEYDILQLKELNLKELERLDIKND